MKISLKWGISMDRQKTLFYGFIVGFTMMILPIPEFFFWVDVIEHVESFFRWLGFIIFVICGVPIIYDVFRYYTKGLR